MGWFRRTPKAPPLPAPVAQAEQTNAFLQLISVLSEQSAKRYGAQLEHEAKMEELALKKHEIEVQNAELLAKAENETRRGKAELSAARRAAGQKGMANLRAKRAVIESCPVCVNPGDPGLSAHAIQWHHSGHPGGQMPLMA